MITFRYRKEYSKLFGTVYRPVAEVYFKDVKGNDMISFMHVDSGADITLLPRKFGENLGLIIEEEEIQDISGVGGRGILFLCYFGCMQVKRNNYQFHYKIYIIYLDYISYPKTSAYIGCQFIYK